MEQESWITYRHQIKKDTEACSDRYQWNQKNGADNFYEDLLLMIENGFIGMENAASIA